MKTAPRFKFVPLALSLILHAALASWGVFSWRQNVNTLWSGGKSGNPGTVYVDLSSGPTALAVPMTRENASNQTAPEVMTRPQTAMARHKSGPSAAKTPATPSRPGAGKGNSVTPAGGTGDGADAAGPVSANAPNVLAAIRAKILAKQKYPGEARRNGEKGTVKVGFKISLEGAVQALRVLKSSGSAALDDAALAAVRAAAPLPYFPQSIALPLEYRLK